MRLNIPSIASHFLRSRISKVCVSIAGNTATEMLEKASSAVRETPFLEFRLDYLEKPQLALPKFKQFFSDNTAATGIATCRRAVNGGKFTGTLASEMEVLGMCAAAGFHMVDIELQSAEALKKGELQRLRDTGIGILISYHDFTGTHDLTGHSSALRPSAPTSSRWFPPPRHSTTT